MVQEQIPFVGAEDEQAYEEADLAARMAAEFADHTEYRDTTQWRGSHMHFEDSEEEAELEEAEEIVLGKKGGVVTGKVRGRQLQID